MRSHSFMRWFGWSGVLLVLAAFIFAPATRSAQAATTVATMVKDINPNVIPDDVYVHGILKSVGNTLFFIATDAQNGMELWKTDGTVAGTSLVKDINAGPEGSFVPPGYRSPARLATVIGNTLFFVANDGHTGYELWKSDGTSAGTQLVKDTLPGPAPKDFDEAPTTDNLTAVNSTLYFSAVSRTSGNTYDLWKSDGTTAGTKLVQKVDAVNLTNVNGTLFFTRGSDNGDFGQGALGELWKSNGTSSGTVLVKKLKPGQQISVHELTNLNGKLFFTSDNGADLWASDGTADGTIILKHGDAISDLTNSNGKLFFTTYVGNDRALWSTDGTVANTKQVKQVDASDLRSINNTLFFGAPNGNSVALWKSDGTAQGTAPLKDIAANVTLDELIKVDDKLFFVAQGIGGRASTLWKSDGTAAGTVRIQEINPGSQDFEHFYLTSVQGTVFFSTEGQLWKSDGSTAGTTVLFGRNVSTGADSNPTELTAVQNKLFFVAEDSAGKGLWTSDGSAGGTQKISAVPAKQLINVGNKLFFHVQDGGSNDGVWTSDGTSAGTVRLQAGVFDELTAVNNTLFFVNGIGSGLWKSNGTAAGTSLVKDVEAAELTNVNGTLFFRKGIFTTPELWKSDGTSAGTVLVASVAPYDLTAVNAKLFFVVANPDNTTQLWKSDGTSAGTVKVATVGAKDAYPPVRSLTNLNGTLYFLANDSKGLELWKSDGTSAGTKRIKDIYSGSNSAFDTSLDPTSKVDGLTVVNGKIFFTANDGKSGYELWSSTGTSSGTVRVRDLNPGITGSYPTSLTNIDGTLMFSADGGMTGRELWRSGGTEGTTKRAQDISAGPGSSSPADFTLVGSTVFFSANDGVHGRELWSIPRASLASDVVDASLVTTDDLDH